MDGLDFAREHVVAIAAAVLLFVVAGARTWRATRRARWVAATPVWVFHAECPESFPSHGSLTCETPGVQYDPTMYLAWCKHCEREEPRDGDRFVLVGTRLRRIN